MKLIHFHIHYTIGPGEKIAVSYSSANDENQLLFLRSYDGSHWVGTLEKKDEGFLTYKYVLLKEQGAIPEAGPVRKLRLKGITTQIFLQDTWRARNNSNQIYLASAFLDVFLKRPPFTIEKKKSSGSNRVVFKLLAADIPQDQYFGVTGNMKELGERLESGV